MSQELHMMQLQLKDAIDFHSLATTSGVVTGYIPRELVGEQEWAAIGNHAQYEGNRSLVDHGLLLFAGSVGYNVELMEPEGGSWSRVGVHRDEVPFRRDGEGVSFVASVLGSYRLLKGFPKVHVDAQDRAKLAEATNFGPQDLDGLTSILTAEVSSGQPLDDVKRTYRIFVFDDYHPHVSMSTILRKNLARVQASQELAYFLGNMNLDREYAQHLGIQEDWQTFQRGVHPNLHSTMAGIRAQSPNLRLSDLGSFYPSGK